MNSFTKRPSRVFASCYVFITAVTILIAPNARAEIAGGVLCSRNEPCDARGVYTRQMVGTSRTDSIRLNPAKIPVESVTGIEAIYYEGMPTLGLVKGLGRVGAAVTPSNNEETFFGMSEFYFAITETHKTSPQASALS